ncbi:MAG TPA: HNH endonuclease [Nocardioides sp.]|nr:HNH endonuclease [Nocardioides sp.]
MPQSRGGASTWLNAVAACAPCNHRKANRTPVEAGLKLRLVPYAPTRAQLAAS